MVCSLFGLVLLAGRGIPGLTTTEAFAVPPGGLPNVPPGPPSNVPGNGLGLANLQVGNDVNHAVPIPGTLLLFAGGLAGFAGWRWKEDRRRKSQTGW